MASTMRQCMGTKSVGHRRAVPAARHRALTVRCAPSSVTLQRALESGAKLLYDGVALDMDGTLTQAHIDFADMRQRTGIPVGDLFTVMESWEEEERIKASMDVILAIEAEASKSVSAKPGLMQLLQLLRDADIKVALVTRNTTASVDAFFDLIGAEWRSTFDRVLTREWRYVKPDKRLLVELAAEWDICPGRLLMVGDSFEDIEVGNAAGSATALVAGGGNEKPGSKLGPPPGAVPTVKVEGLEELSLLLAGTAGGVAAEGSRLSLGWAAGPGGAPPSDPAHPNAPAPGLDFVWRLSQAGVLRTASTSFPRMGAAAGGLAACSVGGGERLLHVGCGSGSLTKLVASQGLQVVAVDADVAAAATRGLLCCWYAGAGGALAPGSLAAAAERGPYDALLIHTPEQEGAGSSGDPAAAAQQLTLERCLQAEALAELASVAAPGGRLCVSAPAAQGQQQEEVGAALAAAGWRLVSCEVVAPARQGQHAPRVEFVAQRL